MMTTSVERGPVGPVAVATTAGATTAAVVAVGGWWRRVAVTVTLPVDYDTLAAAKALLAALVLVLVAGQVVSAAGIWGRLPRSLQPTSRTGRVRLALVHRWTGRVAVLVTLPVAAACLLTFGFDTTSPRALIHSALGCLFYGVFVAKMLALRMKTVPAVAIPFIGSALVVTFVGVCIGPTLGLLEGAWNV